MEPHARLAVVSTAQLATGAVGMALAVRRRHAYDFLVLHGDEDHVLRESLLLGTALSAPAALLATQGVAISVLRRRGPDLEAERILRSLGAVYVVGYLGERLVRRRLRSWDALETPIAAAGIALAAAMAASTGE
jgi:hypothetical protein